MKSPTLTGRTRVGGWVGKVHVTAWVGPGTLRIRNPMSTGRTVVGAVWGVRLLCIRMLWVVRRRQQVYNCTLTGRTRVVGGWVGVGVGEWVQCLLGLGWAASGSAGVGVCRQGELFLGCTPGWRAGRVSQLPPPPPQQHAAPAAPTQTHSCPVNSSLHPQPHPTSAPSPCCHRRRRGAAGGSGAAAAGSDGDCGGAAAGPRRRPGGAGSLFSADGAAGAAG